MDGTCNVCGRDPGLHGHASRMISSHFAFVDTLRGGFHCDDPFHARPFDRTGTNGIDANARRPEFHREGLVRPTSAHLAAA